MSSFPLSHFTLLFSTEQWVVATTSHPPSPFLRQLAAIEGWQLLVLGRVAALEQWEAEGAIFLSWHAQRDQGYHVGELLQLPGKFSPENIGYLYAIEVRKLGKVGQKK